MGGRVQAAAHVSSARVLALLVLAHCANSGGGETFGDPLRVDASFDAPALPQEAAANPTDSAGAEPDDADDATATGDSGDDASGADADDAASDVWAEPGEAAALEGSPEAASTDARGDAPEGGTSEGGPAPGIPRDAGMDGAIPDGGGDGGGDGGDGGPRDASVLPDASFDAGDAGGCGPCGAGFVCGKSHYCQTTTGVPQFGRVFVIVLDDQPLSAISGSASATYLNQLMATFAYGTGYAGVTHPSLPNYLALTSGNPQNVACDCQPGAQTTCNGLTCSAIASNCACPVGVSHLGDELDVAGIPWRQYAESMGGPCNPSMDAGSLFAPNHVPFLYYDDVFGNSGRCMQRVRDYADFAADVTAGSIRFSLVAPNLCHDMHGSCAGDAVKQGDQWLAAQVPLLLATPGFASGGSDVLFIVGDEQADVVGSAPVPFVVVSPLAKRGSTDGTYDHYSLLATIEDGLGVPRLGQAEGYATIADVWR
jgi:acid phosphatase